MTKSPDKRWVLVLIAVLVIAVDRVTKLWVQAHVEIGHTIVVWPHVFRISHVLNTGAAFSMFEGTKSQAMVRWGLIGFSVLAVLVVVGLLWRMGRVLTVTSVALALILGGAVGNLYDRIVYKHVVDFLQVFIVHYHWPDFNVADSCIVVGACLLLLEMLKPQKSSD
jgi:signal peptidase II